MGKVWIGTSGWHYKHWVGRFYPPRLPASRMLEHYIQTFDTVELNNTFYKLPTQKGLLQWRDSTPPDFHFAVKGSRFLTHMKKLKDAKQGLERFLNAVEPLEPKLGPILFQLPPGWELDLERLESFLQLLPPYRRAAFEFRNPTWEVESVYQLLNQYNAANCIFDLAGYASPLKITGNFAYLRLHGPGGKYQGTYSDRTLEEWARKIRSWKTRLDAVYVYFDNDDSGYAPRDAIRLKQLVARN